MSIIAWICLGLIGGTVAAWVSGARHKDLLAGTVVGALGALIGGFMSSVLLGLDISGIDFTSSLVAALGAVILSLFVRAIPATAVFE